MKWGDVFDPLGTVSDQRFEDVSLLEILYNGRFCWGRTSLKRSDGKPVAWQQCEYGCDDIGNRKVARREWVEPAPKHLHSQSAKPVQSTYCAWVCGYYWDCLGDEASVCKWLVGLSGG
jgi:hypothetical protein